MEQPQPSAGELRTLDEIVGYCRAVQEKFSISTSLQPERRMYQRVLIDLCRKCSDRNCPEVCEVKKAYRATL